MNDEHVTAGKFMRELVSNLSRANLAVMAFAVAVAAAVGVALGSEGLAGRFAFAASAGSLALEAGLMWCLLSIGWVQRWIKDGWQ